MELTHPRAEEVIREFEETVASRFANYQSLAALFREKDDAGNTLWEDENRQSFRYNWERKRLHKALFGSIETLLKKEGIAFKLR